MHKDWRKYFQLLSEEKKGGGGKHPSIPLRYKDLF